MSHFWQVLLWIKIKCPIRKCPILGKCPMDTGKCPMKKGIRSCHYFNEIEKKLMELMERKF